MDASTPLPLTVEPSPRDKRGARITLGRLYLDLPRTQLREVADALHDLADRNEAAQ